jgi:hypothetical protein
MERRRWQSVLALLLCGTLCAVFAVLAWTAAAQKCATWDEPNHTAAGWLMLWRHDFRMSPDVPPLWEYWISLLNGPNALHFDAASPVYTQPHTKNDLFWWVVQTLYRTPGNDPIAVVNSARVMALILGVGLAVCIAVWAWQLAGPAAAAAAAFLYCLDPNFIGHAPLAKNDVGFTLAYLAAAYAMWRLGRRLNWLTVSSVALLTAIAMNVKLSGVLMAPVLVIGLGLRACLPEPWVILGRPVQRKTAKLAAAAAVWAITILVTYAGIWAAYGFRFDAGPDGMRSDTNYYISLLRQFQLTAALGRRPVDEELPTWHMPLTTRAVVAMENHRILPQAWTAGFILTQAGDEGRGGFLNGQVYTGSKWYYFPLAAFYKSPLATTAAVILAAGFFFRARKKGLLIPPQRQWTAAALGVPVLVYAAALFSMKLNIGIRHAFPIYPFVFIGVSLAAAAVWNGAADRRDETIRGRVLILILAGSLAAESLWAFPDYIAFFNVVCAPYRLSLLSDSNLDWGQDLPLLAAWQARHPDRVLYFDYFGLCDPAAYGIRYVNIPRGYLFGGPVDIPTRPGVVAVSASTLQCVAGPDLTTIMMSGRRPDEVLGGTIYLFRFDPADYLSTRP